MKKQSMLRPILIAWLAGYISFAGMSQPTPPNSKGYAPVNGQRIYYEIYGQGSPIVLLHGAYMTIELNWKDLIPVLSKNHQVIALEMQGHGHTPYSLRPLSFDSLASDVAKTLATLHINKASIVGYSFGGIIAYKLAFDYPQLVNKLVIISSTYKTDGWQKDQHKLMAQMKPEFLTGTPLHTSYVANAPDTSRWLDFLRGMIAFGAMPYNLGDDHLKAMQVPALLIAADNDGIDKTELVETYRSLGGLRIGDVQGLPKSRLAVLPGLTHVTLMMQTEWLGKMINDFIP